jgi:hypothetical protein
MYDQGCQRLWRSTATCQNPIKRVALNDLAACFNSDEATKGTLVRPVVPATDNSYAAAVMTVRDGRASRKKGQTIGKVQMFALALTGFTHRY